jgi:hypothetical protein
MEILGYILLGIGYIIAFIYGIILLIKAFQTHVGWGICYLFVPFAALVFVIKHWEICKKPFLMSLISIPLIAAGMAIAVIPAMNEAGNAFQEGGWEIEGLPAPIENQ